LMGGFMQTYRVYAIDSNGRISGPAQDIECESDQAALELARTLFDGELTEVWLGDILVGHVAPAKKKA
jgi:predicted ATP-grasp superfamily ATP-dependent carboligase